MKTECEGVNGPLALCDEFVRLPVHLCVTLEWITYLLISCVSQLHCVLMISITSSHLEQQEGSRE